ncbi:MAG: ATP-binding cassette domain-containing protein [Bacteroidetes bacterium]|nr:ATP-binding cassette domain-containing protein [Bacteroidota bacterium]
MSNNQTIIRLEGVSIFQQDNLVLSEVNLQIAPAEFVYLTGSTGSGKSSLLKTLYGELKLERGLGEVAGYHLDTLKKKDIPYLRRKLGIIFQDFQLLFDRNVAENLFFVLKATGWTNPDEMAARTEEVLNLVGLGSKLHKMPFELSGGEQQRLAIARALINKPALILADEPTGNLDPQTSEDILQLLHSLIHQGTSVLMATHDFRVMDRFPARTIRCQDGKVIEM